MSLYSGTVTARERRPAKDGAEYLLLYTKETPKPLAIRNGTIWPPNGSRISADVNPGSRWDFARSREISVDSSPAPAYALEKRIPGVAELLVPLILDWLRFHRTVSSDDVYDKARELLPDRDPRVLGVAFQYLARQRRIRRVGVARSHRKVNHHYPNMAIWELVRQEVNQ
jgi:hypothetical protein